MAGTAVTVRSLERATVLDQMYQVRTSLNAAVVDLEALRAAMVDTIRETVEDLGVGADITARAFYQAPAAMTVLDSVKIIHKGDTAGVQVGSTAIVTLTNITETATIASVTMSATAAANTATALTLTAANADLAASDILGLVVTQGATSDLAAFTLQFQVQRQTVDAAGDLTAYTVNVAPA